MTKPADIVSIGECMVELARGTDGRFGLAYGGDTFNTAVYLARCGVHVAYATAVGDDPYSDGIVAAASAEGIATHLIARVAGRMPGLYLIETSAGERRFYYWRDRSPAREVFDSSDDRLRDAILAARLIYLSGITLSLYRPSGLDRLDAQLAEARLRGARIAIDANYRPRGWGGDASRAQQTLARFYRLADIALPTFDDEQALWGDDKPETTHARLKALGVAEVVVKSGAGGAWITGAESLEPIPCPQLITPVDTTAAGDSFNAAYLAARLGGKSTAESAHAAHRLAAIVIQHRGAIVPRHATAALLDDQD